ncbi:MAG: hypothetical protein K0M69_05950, partial [Youngiibacter sp.]|nr:hypothetical protein [Youngiibacter sp.]
TFLLREKFIAILHAVGNTFSDQFERINYNDEIEALDITSFGGDDRFYSDDNSAVTRIYSGAGNDFFQIGQMFETDRQVDGINGIHTGDQIKTVLTTKGYLTPGNSFNMELYGGDGNDTFSVYANMKPLKLEGENDNDRFILRAFVLADPNAPGQALMNVDSGTGDDYIEYNINAPVTINGGDGYDTVIAVGTELDDVFIVTADGICGAGLNIIIEGAEESFEAYGMEGDDIFHVQSTRTGMVTRLVGGLGSDVFNLMGDVNEHISSTRSIETIVDHNLETIQGPLYLEGFNYDGAPDFTLKSGVGLPYEISPELEDPEITAVNENDMKDKLYAFNDRTNIGTSATLTIDNLSGLGMGGDLPVNEGTVEVPIIKMHKGGVTYTNMEILEIMLGSGNDNFTITDTAGGTMTAVHGGGGEDTIIISGNSGPLVVYGDTSEDGSRYDGTYNVLGYDANTFTNPGIDTINASVSTHGLTIYGGPGDDIINGSQGPDNIAGGSGADEIYGEGGDDIIFGDSGINADLEARMITLITTETASGDTLYGGAGKNIIFGDHGYITYVGMTQGIHKVSAPGTIERIESTSEGNSGDDILTGGDDAEILIGGPGADKIYGNGGDDVMLGDHGDIAVTDMLVTIDSNVRTDGGDDIMTGDLGADIMIGGTGGDEITGGAGNNVMLGDHGTISRTASAGEKVFGTAGIQSIVTGLVGDGGIDIMTGGDDAEILIGGPGADNIYGYGGDDVMLGDHGRITVTGTLVTIESNVEADGGDDIMTGDLGADIMMGGTGGDDMTGGA